MLSNRDRAIALLNTLTVHHGFVRSEAPDAVVFGSAAAVLRGVQFERQIDDLDLFVSPGSFDRLRPYAEKREKNGVPYLYLGHKVEVWKTFPGVDHESVLENAEVIRGTTVASLDDIIKWKQAQGREKDLRDVAAIEKSRS